MEHAKPNIGKQAHSRLSQGEVRVVVIVGRARKREK